MCSIKTLDPTGPFDAHHGMHHAGRPAGLLLLDICLSETRPPAALDRQRSGGPEADTATSRFVQTGIVMYLIYFDNFGGAVNNETRVA
jgi:hypothetical protein